MTIGIYRLCFNGTDRCYVGQSVNIEKRYKQHLSSFINNKANPKMMEAYIQYGNPFLEILCECTVEELDIAENEAIEIFDCVNNGFNVLEHATDTPESRGENNGHAKYSNCQVEKVLELLCDPKITFVKISEITGVSVSIIGQTACGKTHQWLEEKYPDMYSNVMSLNGTRISIRNSSGARGIKYLPVVSPSGEVYNNISNVREFCRQHALHQSAFSMLLKGNRKIHKGWRIATDG
jgi:group I intron endonuclease